MSNSNEMKKTLGLSTALATVVGSVIGSGVFFKPQSIYTTTGGAPGLGMIAWIIGGFASIAAALTFAEIAILIPKTGGMVAYLEEAFGKKLGYLTGWMQSVLFYPAMIAALSVICAQQLELFTNNPALTPAVTIAIIIIIIVLNALGSGVGGAVQVVSTVCKLIPLILLMIFGFIKGSGQNPIFSPMVGEGIRAGNALSSLLLAVLFSFEGWTNVGAIAGEMKNPGKDLPLAIVGGVSAIMAVYFVINLAYLWVLPASTLGATTTPAADVATAIFGEVGGKIIAVGIMISVFGACNGFVLSGSRVAYSLAAEGSLPASNVLSKLNSAQVPMNSIILVGAIGAVYSLTGQFNLLTDVAVFSCWIFYTLTFVAVMKLRKMEKWANADRIYKVPLYPVIPIIAIVSGVYVILNQLFICDSVTLSETFATLGSGHLIEAISTDNRLRSVISIIITLIGLPVYSAISKSK